MMEQQICISQSSWPGPQLEDGTKAVIATPHQLGSNSRVTADSDQEWH